MVPGLAIFSRRSSAIAAWLAGTDLAYCKAVLESRELLIEVGLDTQYLLARVRDAQQQLEAQVRLRTPPPARRPGTGQPLSLSPAAVSFHVAALRGRESEHGGSTLPLRAGGAGRGAARRVLAPEGHGGDALSATHRADIYNNSNARCWRGYDGAAPWRPARGRAACRRHHTAPHITDHSTTPYC